MNVPDIYNLGPHQYSFFKHKLKAAPLGQKSKEQYGVRYNLFGLNGHTERPRPGIPNSQGWTESPKRFDSTIEAEMYILHLLRAQDHTND